MSNGTAIQHTPGSTDILLAPNQTYYATYNTEAYPTSANSNTVVAAFTLDGAILRWTQTNANTPGATQTVLTSLSASTLISTGGSTQSLQIVNPIDSADPTSYINTQVSVIKLQ